MSNQSAVSYVRCRMMKSVPLVVCFFLFISSSFVYGAPWAVVANYGDRTVNTIDLGTEPPTVYGPFLSGQLGTVGTLYDVAITPDGKYALVSSYYNPTTADSTVYRVDISDPTNPVAAGTVVLTGYNGLDIAIAPNGQFALLSDGRSLTNPQPNKLAIVDLNTFTLTTLYTLTTPAAGAVAVAIAPDNQTVIICDRDSHRIIYGTVNPATGLTSEATIATGTNSYPINVTISPDGKTALVANRSNEVKVLQITGPGTVVAGTPVSGVPSRQQSIAFSPNGQKAYFISSGESAPNTHTLSWLQVNGPGNVTLGGANVVTFATNGTNRHLGADVLAVYPSGDYLLAGNAVDTTSGNTVVNHVRRVNLVTFAIDAVNTNRAFPMGIDVTWQCLPPRTGQMTCYDSAGVEIVCTDTGEDGEKMAGVVWPIPRFTNPDGTVPVSGNVVMDQLTGLMWPRDGGTPTAVGCTGGAMTWQNALDYVACLNANAYLGYNDWRLSNANEMESLVNAERSDTATWLNGQGFNNVQSALNYYWTSTTFTNNSARAWVVLLDYGQVGRQSKNNSNFAWPVRTEKPGIIQLPKTGQTASYATGDDGDLKKGVIWHNPRFTNPDGTTPVSGDLVVDQLTGLTWTHDANGPGPSGCGPGTAKTWQAALDYVKCLNRNDYLGHSDWRLPNRKELRSLVDYGRYNPALPAGHPFINVQSVLYWTSTSAGYDLDSAWDVDFVNGNEDLNVKGTLYRVWPVRDGLVTGCTSTSSGLVSWWSGDNTANDIIGSNHGTMMSGATFAPGMVGEAFSFDGAEANFVEIPNSSELNPSGAFSVDGWFYIDPAANAGKIATLVAKTEGSTNNGWALYFDDRWSTKSLKFVLGTVLELPNAIPAANWYHIAGVFDPSPTPNSKIYINGAPVASVNSGGAQPNGLNVRIGAMYWTDAYHQGNDRLNGKADEVEFFNRALTAEEIAAIYNAGSAGKCKPCTSPPSGMVGWWSGDGHPFDLVGSNNGTLHGAATYADGKVEKAFSFDGLTNFVSVPNTPSLDFTDGDFSIDAWIYPATVDTYGEGIAGRLPSDNSSGWGFAIQGSTYGTAGKLNIFGKGNWIGQSNGTVATNIWTHVAITRSGNSLTYYINGSPSGSYTNAYSTGSFNNSLSLVIGDIYPSWAESVWRFSGLIDEVEIFNRALSAGEIAAIYAAGNAGKCKPCFTPPSNLVSWWKGENNANDSAYNNHGTVHGATFSAGKVGQAFSFDGVDDYVQIVAPAGLPVGNAPRSMDLWFRTPRNPTSQTENALVQYGSPSNGQMFGLITSGTCPGKLYFYGHSADLCGTTTILPDTWYHAVVTYDGTTLSLYLNGNLESQAPMTLNTVIDANGLTIGYRVGGALWQGLIDEVEVFNRALSAEEIAAIYAAGSAGKCSFTFIYVSKDDLCGGNNPCFPNIQNGIASASIPATIKITGETYIEDILLDFSREITLQGGWDTSFTSNSSYTTIDGSITITNGTMIVEYIILQ